MGLWTRIKPPFWERQGDPGTQSLNYRRLWKSTFGAAVAVSLIPLILMTAITFYQFEQQYRLQLNEIVSQVHRLISNTRLQIGFFLQERQAALGYIVLENSFEQLSDERRLSAIFFNLKRAFGGFIDIGLIDSQGLQRAYVGPYALEGHVYKDQDWYKEVLIRGTYVSEVFLGHRQVPHIVIAVKHELNDGRFYVLRATINTARINDIIAAMNIHPSSDAFIANQKGVLQTPSRFFGGALEQSRLPMSTAQGAIDVVQLPGPEEQPLVVGYARVDAAPFVLMLVKQPDVLLLKWGLFRLNVLVLAVVSIVIILIVSFKGSSSLVNRLYLADLKRAAVLHEIEYTSKLASIGRLAAGVAHEINNPIAIINEKAGLLKDIISAREEDGPQKDKFLHLADSILSSVKRVSAVTHRLLGFARHLDVSYETIQLGALVNEVLGFLGKEAEHRNIDINVRTDKDVPNIESDRGQLQQVLLNILNNSLAAVNNGGEINISVAHIQPDTVALSIADNGVGIPKENLKSIFEPFFSTRGARGTGLGLSITYGIVQKLGGSISVESQEGEGTTFTITLPVKRQA
ncbi:MAG: ATP-binding protein [Pseudomonadota bacterium]